MERVQKKEAFIFWLDEIGMKDVDLAGRKNASLGEMRSKLQKLGIQVPRGFVVTSRAWEYFLKEAGFGEIVEKQLRGLDARNLKELQRRGRAIRKIILQAELPGELKREIGEAYRKLGENSSVAVRSSAIAEDLEDASFAGQQETYLNVQGESAVMEAVQKVMASLFSDRAISYRQDKGFSQRESMLAVGVQHMVRSDKATSGVMFTLDLETGFDKVVVINASYGLGEMIAGGEVTPDEFVVFKPLIGQREQGILVKILGAKKQKLIYGANGTKKVPIPKRDRKTFCLQDKEILKLAQWACAIERHFGKPMDIEWAKDGVTNEFVILQARPETVHSRAFKNVYRQYQLKEKGIVLASGTAVGTKIAAGRVRIIRRLQDMHKLRKGEVLVTHITDPDWEPVMKGAVAVITDKGGRTSHAAIISREFEIPAIVGTGNATRVLKNGQFVTIDCSSGNEGKVYKGALPFTKEEHKFERVPETKTKVMVNIGAPDEAFKNAWLPVQGVGLGRLEFIINSYIKIHPNALIHYPKLKGRIKKQIDALCRGYDDKKQFYVDKLAEGIAKIGAAFWPHEVIIRFSDFKTNEYRQLIGGELYELVEQNPMLSWRGASRYYDKRFQEAFGLECLALKKVRENIGLRNVIPMVPFCRTVEEAEKVIALMKEFGLSKTADPQLRIIMMCEIPSNVILADEFLDLFDGMSIGSNDLTQLVLGIDRDSELGSSIGNENNPAVKQMIQQVISVCKRRNKSIGICGQAPSDYPEFTKFLVEQGIDSISLNPDAVIPTISYIAEAEETQKPQ